MADRIATDMPSVVAACIEACPQTPETADFGGILARAVHAMRSTSPPDLDATAVDVDSDAQRAGEPMHVLQAYAVVRSTVGTIWLREQQHAADAAAQLLTFNDVLDRLLAQDLKRALARTERTQDLFIAMLAHDLRTPLNAMLMSAALLQRRVALTPECAEVGRRIASSGERMRRLVKDLLEYARIRVGSGVPLHLSSCAIDDVVRGTIEELQLLHADRSIALTLDGDTSGCWDRERIAQAVSNLAGNALEHSAKDAFVAVKVRGEADHVRISVGNGSSSVPPELERTLTERAWLGETLAPYACARGVRLGLFIVRAIVAAHGGALDIASADGCTRFDIVLPRRIASRADADSGEPQMQVA